MIAAGRTLLEQARELQALAQTGLAYCKDRSLRPGALRAHPRDSGRHARHAGRRAGRRDAPAAQRRIPDAETRYSRGHRDPDWGTLFE